MAKNQEIVPQTLLNCTRLVSKVYQNVRTVNCHTNGTKTLKDAVKKVSMDLQPQEDPTQVETIDPVLLDSFIETRKRINEEVSKNIKKAQTQ